jgi:phosphatidylethanolamine-binding protein (PEBP) family uncharacterized protein
MRRCLLAVLTLALFAMGAACGTSGRDLQPPPPGVTGPPRRTSSTLGISSTTTAAFSIFSTAFGPESRIPSEFTCDGSGTSPPLSFSGAPKGTKQMALLVLDTDNNDEVQWLVTGLPPALTGIAKGGPPQGGTQVVAWKAPCPTGGGSHSYEFELLALPTAATPGTTAGADTSALVRSLQQQATSSAAFSATFGH